MDASIANLAMQKAFHDKGITGKNVVVHLLDTGVTPTGWLVGHVTGDKMDPKDQKDHGKFVASQIARGLPDAEIRSKRIIPGGGSVMYNALVQVYNEARADRKRLHIVNMSVGLLGNEKSEIIAKIRDIIDKLVAYGVPVICAAGNDDQKPVGLYPATFQSPICVTGIYADGSRAKFSNYPDEADFADWAVNITIEGVDHPNWTKSGTSMACPEVLVKAGLIGDAYIVVNDVRPTESYIYQELKKRVAEDLGTPGWDPYYGNGWVYSLDIIVSDVAPATDPIPYVTDLGLAWPDGRSPRDITDHIQVHHTVGDYSTPNKWAALHKDRQTENGWRGIEYSFGINKDGVIFEGRGLQYKHGAVKNSLTKNAKGIGAADRSVSITLIGDMRDAGMPTFKQRSAAIRLLYDLIQYYKLPVSAILGHREIPVYENGKVIGTYATACPVIDMDALRADVAAFGNVTPAPDPDPGPLPEPDPEPEVPDVEVPCLPIVGTYPYRAYYGGATFMNMRDLPSTDGKIVTKVKRHENVIVLGHIGDWLYLLMPDRPSDPLPVGYSMKTNFVKGKR